MPSPKTLDLRDHDNLIGLDDWTISHDQTRLTCPPTDNPTKRRFLLEGPSGSHSLLVSATGPERLNAHWQGFTADYRNLPDDARGMITWHRTTTGTHFAELSGNRIEVRRLAPRKREFRAILNGEPLGIFRDMETAQDHAERAIRAALSGRTQEGQPKAR